MSIVTSSLNPESVKLTLDQAFKRMLIRSNGSILPLDTFNYATICSCCGAALVDKNGTVLYNGSGGAAPRVPISSEMCRVNAQRRFPSHVEYYTKQWAYVEDRPGVIMGNMPMGELISLCYPGKKNPELFASVEGMEFNDTESGVWSLIWTKENMK